MEEYLMGFDAAFFGFNDAEACDPWIWMERCASSE